MPLFESILSSEIARRRRVGEARSKALADPSKMQDLLAKGLKFHVPEGKKIRTKRYPTKLAATEAAIPKSDPRSTLGTAAWSRYTGMMEDPRFERYRPRDILAAAGEMEFDKRREAIHRHIQKQHTGTLSTFIHEPYAPIPGQEEWEREHPPRIHKIGAEWSALLGAGTKAGIEAAKWSLGKGAAAKMGRKPALRLLGKAGPWGKLAVAGAVAVPGFRVFEEVSQRTEEKVLETEYGKKHPVAAMLVGMGTGLVAGAAIPVEAVFGGMLTSAGGKSITKFQRLIRAREKAAEEVTARPDAKHLMDYWRINKETLGAAEGAAKAIDKEKGKLLDVLTSKIEKERAEAIPLPGAVARRGIFTPEGLEAMRKVKKVPIIPAEGVIKYTPEELAAVGKYTFKDIKTKEGVEKIIVEVSKGTPREEAVQLVGSMEAGIKRHFPMKPSKEPKIGSRLKGSIKALGYSDSDIKGLTYKRALKIKKAARATEARNKITEGLKNIVSVKKSKFDVSPEGQGERLYKWARELSPQKRATLVEKGTIPEAVNRRIVQEQRAAVEAGPEYKGYIAEEAAKDERFLESLGSGEVATEKGTYEVLSKKDFVARMMKDKGGKAAIAIGAGIGAGAMAPEEAEAGYIDSLAKVFKAATTKEATKVAEKLGVRYEGVQKFKDKPYLHLFTDSKTGSTIATSTARTEDVSSKLAENRALWEKPGDIVKGFVAAMSTIPLLDVLSPRQAEAGGIPDAAGRVITELTGEMLKKSSPGNLGKLLGTMKKLGIIPEKQIDPHVLPKPMRPIELIPDLKDIRAEAADMAAIGQRVLSPMTQFWHYTGIKGGRELQNNAATQWSNAQTCAIYNTITGQRTLMSILKDYIPGYGSSAKPLIEAMKPVVSTYYKPMQERAYHLGMKDYFEKLSIKEWGKIQKKAKYTKGEQDQALAALEILENKAMTHKTALAGSENIVRDYQKAWRDVIEPMSLQPEHSGVRIFLAAEDTAMFEHYPWLKGKLSFEEKAAAAKIKDMMEMYGTQVVEAGEKIITTRPFMHHAWHPGMDTKGAIRDIKERHRGTAYNPPMAKLHSRSAGFMPMVPDAEYSVTTYLSDINTRLEALNFWKKGEKGGWWAFKQAITENPGIAPEGLLRAFRAFEDGFKPYQKTTASKWAERAYAFEVARLLAFSLSVPFKHSLKLLSDLRIFGVEGAKAMPKAFTASVKIAIKQRGGEQWLKDKGWGLDVMDEAVEALTETGKLYRLVTDISPFRVTETMGDKALEAFNRIGGTPVAAIERFDRAVSVVASMRMAAKKGMTPAQATYSVFDTVLKSNFLSGTLNPGWLRNPFIRLMLVFQGTPYKIMEQRAMLYKRGGQALVNTVKQLRKDVIKGEQEFKWEMIKQGLSSEKDIFGTSIMTQCMRELILVGTAVGAGKMLWDIDLAHHFFHPPFFKLRTKEIAIGTSPVIGAGLATYDKWMEEDYDEFLVSTFFNEWFNYTIKGVPAPLPVNFKKQIRLSQDDIPEIYRDSKLKYLFGIPAKHED